MSVANEAPKEEGETLLLWDWMVPKGNDAVEFKELKQFFNCFKP